MIAMEKWMLKFPKANFSSFFDATNMSSSLVSTSYKASGHWRYCGRVGLALDNSVLTYVLLCMWVRYRDVALFSAPEPKAQVHYCDHSLSVVRPSVRLSVRPSSVVNFSHFRLLLWNSKTEFYETWQETRSLQNSTKFCVFRADRKNKMAALASDLLRHFRLLLWNRWTEFNETWQEARSQCPLPSLCFSGRSKKQDGRPGRPGLWLAETFSTSPLKPLNRIQRNLTGNKIFMSSTKFVFFGPNWKTR